MRFLTKDALKPVLAELDRLRRELAGLGGTIVQECGVCGSCSEVVYPLYLQNPRGRNPYSHVWICGCCVEDVKCVIRVLDKRREAQEVKP